MRTVRITRGDALIEIKEMFCGPGSGYKPVPEYVGRTMPSIYFSVTIDGRTANCSDWKFTRDELRLSDEEAEKLVSDARKWLAENDK